MKVLFLFYLAKCGGRNLEIENADIKESGHGIYKSKKITPNVWCEPQLVDINKKD